MLEGSVMEASEPQDLKVLSRMDVKPGGSVMEVNPDSEKALLAMDLRLDGSVMEASEPQDLKAESPMDVRFDGSVMEASEPQE